MAGLAVEDRIGAGGTWRVLRLQAPPLNLLTQGLRAALLAGLRHAVVDPAIKGIVVAGAARAFSGGLSLGDWGQVQGAPTLADVTMEIAASPKPVVAALQGLVLNGGAELALACHARVAGADVRFGWRGVQVGLLPDAGGTQRLPALVGAEAAIALLRDGRLIGSAEASSMGLVDAVSGGDAVEAALAGPVTRPAQGLRDGRGYQAAVAAARVGADAWMGRMLDCVAAAQVLPLAQGLAFEAVAAGEMAATARAAGLLHAMRAEMRLASAGAGVQAVPHVALWGTGALALPALRAGMTVTVAEAARDRLVARLEKLALAQEADVQAGRLTPAAREAEWARVVPVVGVPVAELVFAGGAGAGEGALVLGRDVLLPAPGVAEVLVDSTVAVATLRRMGLRVAVTRKGVVAALQGAVQRALGVLAAQGVALDGCVPAWLRVAPPTATGAHVMTAADVEARIMGALVAEGARLVASGAVQAASDVDVLAIWGLGMPRAVGGPLFQADRRGLLLVRRDLALWAQEDAVWAPDALFDRLIAEGVGFGASASVPAG